MSLSLFNLLQFPLAVFPNVVTSIIEASVSFTRLFNFFTSEVHYPYSIFKFTIQELDADAVTFEPVTPRSFANETCQRVSIENATLTWKKDKIGDQDFVLRDISLSCQDASLLSIVGRYHHFLKILTPLVSEVAKVH